MVTDPTLVDFRFKAAKASFKVANAVCFNEIEKEIRLPSFHAPDDPSTTWLFKMTPEKPCYDFPGFCFLNLKLVFESPIHQTLIVRPILNVNQTSSKPNYDDFTKNHGDKGVKWDSFRFRSSIVCSKRTSYIPFAPIKVAFINEVTNCLVIEAEVNYCEDCEDNYEVGGLPREPSVPFAGEKCLVDSLAALLASGEQADATLVVDGEELPAHRLMLSLQSDVFKAMFSTACSEKDSGRIAIKDLGLPVVKQLLRFIYTGSVDADQDCLPALLVAADKYMVAGLRELCQRRLEKALRDDLRQPSVPEVSSVLLCDSLRVAFLVDCASLRQVAVDHLRGHPELVRTPAWAELTAGPHRAAAALALLDAMAPAAPPAAAPKEGGQDAAVSETAAP